MSCATTGGTGAAAPSSPEHFMKQRIRKDLSRWSRKLLLCLGLENIGKHIVGESKWDKLYDGCPSGDSAGDPENTPTDFESQTDNTDTGNQSPANPSSPPAEAIEENDEEEGAMRITRSKEMNEENLEEGVNEEDDHDRRSGGVGCDEGEDEKRELEGEEDFEDECPRTPQHQPQPQSVEANNNVGEGSVVGEDEEAEDSRMSPSTTPVDPAESPACSEPGSEEKAGQGGALVDNLFQILPYWYFLNRAFGQGGSGGGPPGAGLLPPNPSENLEMGEEQEVEEEEEDNVSNDERAVAASQVAGHPLLNSNHPSNTSSQRLNSILLLESIRQQLQSQGHQDTGLNEDTVPSVQHGFQLSELLSRMSSGGGDIGGNIPWALDRKNLVMDSQNSHVATAGGDQDLDDQPLDLTSSSSKLSRGGGTDGGDKSSRYGDYSGPAFAGADKQQLHNSPFILDEQTSKVFRSNPRSSKGYTAQELQAALHDIQSGKLGTRRAAVIYGIPRSTLRNKVYKLGKDRGRLFNANGPATLLNNNNNHNNNLNNNNNNNNTKGKDLVGGRAGPGSLLGKLSYLQGLNPSGYHPQTRSSAQSRFTGTDDETEESASALNFVKNMRVPPSLYAINNGDISEGKPGDLSPRMATQQTSLSQLISKHAQAQQRAHHHYQNASAVGGSPMDLGMDDSCQSSGGDLEHGPGHLSHKDWKYALLRQEQLLGQQQRPGVQSNHRQPSHSQHQQEDPSTSLDLAGKKSRPKRGKYRNYDREALVKAVRAVQNGEMSVHRAGSFFGVPHSTLEYKVKERHLLRRPKRKEVTSPVSQAKSSSPESSSDASTARQASSSIFSKGLAKTLPASSNTSTTSNNNNSRGGMSNSYLFPLTSDLRESLSRYLSADQDDEKVRSRDDPGTSHSSQMEDGASSGGRHEHEDDNGRNDDRSSGGGGGGGPIGALALEGLLGNRLSNLFQLNDILLRSSSGGAGGGAARDNLLDLSSKK